jgi:acyl-coenzyme A synthetase/AMP-(fatty) acid ligase
VEIKAVLVASIAEAVVVGCPHKVKGQGIFATLEKGSGTPWSLPKKSAPSARRHFELFRARMVELEGWWVLDVALLVRR